MKVLLLFSFFVSIQSRASEFESKCAFRTMNEATESFKHCVAIQKDKTIDISPLYRKKMIFKNKGLTELYLDDQCYWVNRQYVAMRTHCFDNGSDYFSEGLTRYIGINEKFGFMDRKLKVLIPPNFDFVFPFKNGKAQVCNGCTKVQTGENTSMEGGTWGEIDKSGKLLGQLSPRSEKSK